jgi:nucleoside-diphosphate-sugar epimerase
MKKVKILVTGSTGFVGQQVIKALSLLEVELSLVLRADKSTFYNKNKNITSVIDSKNIFDESDSWWQEKCLGIDLLIHLAWYAEPGKYLDSPINEQCFQGTMKMAKGAAQAGVKRFIGIGTCFEYQFSDLPLDISSPLDPQTQYAAAKVKTFHHLTSFFKEHKTEFLWCRLFYLFGEGEDDRRLIPFLRKQLAAGKEVELTSGDKVKDYLNIEEAGKIITGLAMNKHTGPYNVCSGQPITIKKIAEEIADEYGRRDLLKFGNLQRESVDPSYIVGVKTDSNF